MSDNPGATTSANATPAKAEFRGGLLPSLRVNGALRAGAFYAQAFGAEIAASIPPDVQGRTMHVHLYVNGQSLVLSDDFPEKGIPLREPQGYMLLLVLAPREIDAWWQRAIDAGCSVKIPLANQFWGDRYGQLTDPFGVDWALDAPAA